LHHHWLNAYFQVSDAELPALQRLYHYSVVGWVGSEPSGFFLPVCGLQSTGMEALKYLWGFLITAASLFAFYRTHLRPMFERIKEVVFVSTSPPIRDCENDGRLLDIELEVLMKDQGDYKFIVWADGKETINTRQQTSDLGKTYSVLVELPIIPPKGVKRIEIDIRRWFRLYRFTRKELPLLPILRIGTQR
jgi:hypothetical protein